MSLCRSLPALEVGEVIADGLLGDVEDGGEVGLGEVNGGIGDVDGGWAGEAGVDGVGVHTYG